MKSIRMNVFCLVMIAVITAMGSSLAQEDNSGSPVYSVCTIYIPGLLKEDLTGPFGDLNSEISRRANVQLVLKQFPPKRGNFYFKEKQCDIIFPVMPSNFDDETIYDRSSAFYVKKDFVFTRKGTPLIATLTDLENLQGPVGGTFGYTFPEDFLSNPQLDFDFAPNDDLNLKKLGSGRIAAFIVEERSGLQAAQNTNLEDAIQYDPATPLFTQDVFYAFQSEPRLQAVREAVSQAIDEMKADGSLARILKVLQSPQQ